MNLKRAMLSAVLIWVLGVSAYTGSFFIHLMADPNLQANLVLTFALIPSAILGAKLYYRSGLKTNGFKLGTGMFFIAMLLDALITVPLYIIPEGGDHISFFSDPGFWFIAVEYILTVGLYWRFKVFTRSRKLFS
ncbi:DUF5367 family protein [Croceimicrobium sp.]|uniref:DUF5367 family protein n=1 Tax=Croceimicrobium sp. TaxID=2828340 RepID=UPI003BA9DA16